ncbi:MAG: hypothetical protein MK098_00170 [Marinovum sp.]|nr:hypothetical protein [Marinovum sp.]
MNVANPQFARIETANVSGEQTRLLRQLEHVLDVFWLKRDSKLIDETIAQGARFYIDHDTEPMSFEAYAEIMEQYSLQVEFSRITVADFGQLAPNRCVARLAIDGRIITLDKRHTLYVTKYASFEDGRLTEARYMVDRYNWLVGLGALPDDAYFMSLSGARFE